MGMGRQAIAIVLVGAAVSCGKTLEVDDAAVPDAGAAGRDASAEAGADAAACGSTRARALRCGGTTCDLVGGQACCADGTDRKCGARSGGCAGTQMNCQGTADCEKGEVCCQTGGSIGSRCQADCAGRPRYCYGSEECAPGEGCLPLGAGEQDIWACAPCR